MTETIQHDPFVGPGEVPQLCRAIDWAATPLGPVEEWSAALRGAIRTCMESPFPINLWCGPERVLIYNDAYRPVLGAKHPASLGRRGAEVWSEIWEHIAPMFEQIEAGGAAVYQEDAPFVMRRAGGDIEGSEPNAWFTFALSPVRDDAGDIIAMLNVVSETTARILAEGDLRAARAGAERAEARLREVFTQAPTFMAVLRGRDHVFEYVNSSYYQLIGRRDVIGRPVRDALPEIRGQGFEELLDEVLETGEPYVGREIAIHLSRSPGADPEPRFLDFVYYPITEGDGTRTGVVAHGSDVTEHVLSRREAQRARQEAEEASRAKSQFLANMSHEIRTPINAIIGYTDLLALGITGPVSPAQRDQLERVRTSSQHLLAIVEDVLDVAKVEAGRMNVGRERVQVQTTIDTAISLVAPQAADRGIAIVDRSTGHDDLAYVGDEARVRQILVNLLSNAIKFTERGGEVRIECGLVERPGGLEAAVDGPLTYVRVEDTGIGIAPEDLESVFQPFTQVDAALPRTRGGTGLGLTISRHLARLMGGDLTLESEQGVGSTFTVWLPNDVTALDAEVIVEARDVTPGNLAAVGRNLQQSINGILERYKKRLRGDELIPGASDVGDADLEDHASTFLIDIAQSLVVLEESKAVPERLLQDGSEIQRAIAQLHGRQRAQLGWTGESLTREWVILWEEVERAVRRAMPLGADIGGALELLKRFLDRGERVSARSRSGMAADRG